MNFSLQILGSSSAVPTKDRNQTALLLDLGSQSILFDAGEGVQKQFINYGIKSFKISHIFISHLHPDHFIGLIGLLCSWGLLRRKDKLTIVSPKGIEQIINLQLEISGINLHYEVVYITPKNEDDNLVISTDSFYVKSFRLNHRVNCFGYVLKEQKHERKLIAEKVQIEDIPHRAFPILKKGNDFVDDNGNLYSHMDYTTQPPKSRSFAYFTDTTVKYNLAAYLDGVDLLYHDSTFLGSLEQKANETGHSTTSQAANFAKISKVKKLLLGHFSSRYGSLTELENEAREIFKESYLATEGRTFEVNLNKYEK